MTYWRVFIDFLPVKTRNSCLSEASSVTTLSEAERRAVRSQSTIVGYEIQYSEPYSKVKGSNNMVKGIIFGVDTDITEEELCEETGAQSAKRIMKDMMEII